jgi:hypothetical protein
MTADSTSSGQVIPGSLADLVERPLIAHLATVRPDGTPQVNPTWFRFDGEYLVADHDPPPPEEPQLAASARGRAVDL